MLALLVMNVQMLNIKQAKPIIMWLIPRSLAQAPAETLFLIFWLAQEGKKEHNAWHIHSSYTQS